MSLVRCPACQTVFRLQAEQLDAHGGMVRCGHCFVPFNARLNIVAPGTRNTATAPEAAAADAMPAAPSTSHVRDTAAEDAGRPFFVLEEAEPEALEGEAPQSFAATLDALRRDNFAQPATPPAVFRTRSETDRRAASLSATPDAAVADPLAFGIPEDLPPLQVESPQQDEPHPPRVDRGPATRAIEARVEPVTSLPPELAAHFVRPERSSEPPSHEPAATSTASSTIATSHIDKAAILPSDDGAGTMDHTSARDFIRRETDAEDDEDDDAIRARYRPTGTAPPTTGGRWFLGLSLGMLMGLLAAQGGYLFRSEIARQWPQMRPYLELMCAHMECALGLPKVIDEIVIETSDLEFVAGARNNHVLNAVIRNRANFPQTVPHLELTLTDARDRAVIRRVLEPREWLRDAPAEAGLAPRATVPVRLGFNTAGVDSAVGYRLYLFYP